MFCIHFDADAIFAELTQKPRCSLLCLAKIYGSEIAKEVRCVRMSFDCDGKVQFTNVEREREKKWEKKCSVHLFDDVENKFNGKQAQKSKWLSCSRAKHKNDQTRPKEWKDKWEKAREIIRMR